MGGGDSLVMALTRQQISQVFRPTGPKRISIGNAWTSGGTLNITQGVDLSLPLRGLRLVVKGRLVIGGADLASVHPEGLLNMISNINITGTNSLLGGNTTLYNTDFATAFVMQHLFQERSGSMEVILSSINTIRTSPSTPFPAAAASFAGGYGTITQGTYDFIMVLDLPFAPFGANPLSQPGFLVRQDEWGNTLQVQLTYGTQANAAVEGFYGTGAAGTTYTWTAYASAAGSPTVDVYGLPVIMGNDVKQLVTPGFLARTTQPLTTVLQSSLTNGALLDLQKKATTRVFFKVGTSTLAPYFATLSDNNVTGLGILIGGNRVVREVDDVFAHKQDLVTQYSRAPIQGYNCFDFIQSGNPFSAYPGDQVGGGTSFQLVANVTGVANAYGIVMQEQMLYPPSGALYA
jgi:hypothetical protein